ncbi:alkaline phosphatase [Alkaliflexus imshenetskii]|uniref:alkaline phosphatase n=1 Tax=Alkaliflexus imshenetskii TaxID=286730 RepID=UPI000694A2BE|nr:alkaline phosphatase [Alkaliflexus imshenetskii]
MIKQFSIGVISPILIILTLLASCSFKTSQVSAEEESLLLYPGGDFYPVTEFNHNFLNETPKNVVLFIGDGMGLTQIHAAMIANGGSLFLNNFRHIGFTTTHSYSSFVTGSAEAATAIASGVKTYGGAIGVDPDTNAVKTILHKAIEKGLSTGLISTSAITHATPAAFIAHQPDRKMYEEIAGDFLKYEIDLLIGGGLRHFGERSDGQNLLLKLNDKGYQIYHKLYEIAAAKSGKLVGLTADEHNGRVDQRGYVLPVATESALNILSENEKGFFVMIEGSQIDWAGHENNIVYLIEEMLDFDKAIGRALEFAEMNKETLIIVASDHETGGMTIHDGCYKAGMVKANFATPKHTGVLVPIFAYGPGAHLFTGFMDNTDIHNVIEELLFRLD